MFIKSDKFLPPVQIYKILLSSSLDLIYSVPVHLSSKQFSGSEICDPRPPTFWKISHYYYYYYY